MQGEPAQPPNTTTLNVKETAEAIAEGSDTASKTADNGLGNPGVPDPASPSTRFWSKGVGLVQAPVSQDANGKWVAKVPQRTMSASLTFGPPGAAANAFIKYSVVPTSLSARILRDGQPITDANRKVLPGQQVKLTVESTGASQNGWSWTKPGGDPFKIYRATTAKGDRIELGEDDGTDIGADDLNSQSFIFYFAQSTNAQYAVRCSVTLTPQGGSPLTVSISDNLQIVEPPSALTPESMGRPQVVNDVFNGGALSIGLFGLQGTAGIAWSGRVSTPAGFSQGYWHFVQLVTDNTTYDVDNQTTDLADDQKKAGKFNNSRVLDTKYPYEPGLPGWPTDGSVQETNDTPALTLANIVSSANKGGTFETYLMFLPPPSPGGGSSCWVPLRRFTWGYNGSASRPPNGWYSGQSLTATRNPQTGLPVSSEWSKHPEWQDVWTPEFVNR